MKTPPPFLHLLLLGTIIACAGNGDRAAGDDRAGLPADTTDGDANASDADPADSDDDNLADDHAPGDPRPDVEADEAGEAGHTDSDAHTYTDAGGDLPDTPIAPLPLPFVPIPVETPTIDGVFLQEWNHTTPEIDPRIGPIVDVVLAPPRFVGWDTPTQITARGPVIRTTPEGIVTATIHDEAADLIGAAVSPSQLALANESTLWTVSPDGDLVPNPAPSSTRIARLTSGTERVWVLTSTGLGWVDDEGTVTWDVDGPAVLALGEDHEGVVIATEGSIARWPSGERLGEGSPTWELSSGVAPGYEAIILDVLLPEPLDVVALYRDGIYALQESDGDARLVAVDLFASDRVPLRSAVEAVRTGDGGFVVVGPEGAWRMMDRGDGPEWRVYPAERWLPSEDVRGVATPAVDELSPIYFATAAGHGFVTAEYTTLEQKLAHFVTRIVERHDRDGAVADSRLTRRGDLTSSIPWDSDNDGGWTSYWLLAECYRHLVTGAPDARASFDRSLERMLALQTLTGTEHFLARAVIRRSTCELDDCDDPDDGEWFLSPDGEWWVKGDTSNDEVVSHMFMMGPAYDLCATPEQRAGIRQHVTRIVGGIIDNGYQLVDIDGEVTRYGQFDPDYVNFQLGGRTSDGGRRSVAMLGILNLAWHVSGEQRFIDAKRYLIEEHHYDVNALTESEYPLRWGRYSGDNNELSTQGFVSLIRYEPDPTLREMWFDAWSRTYAGIAVQQAAFWDVANHLLGGRAGDLETIVRWLRLAPVDMIRWSIHNGHRRDLVRPPPSYEQSGRMRSDGRIIPYDERATDRWNTDQYRVDNGMDGWLEMDGADVLAPYWMARYYGLIQTRD